MTMTKIGSRLEGKPDLRPRRDYITRSAGAARRLADRALEYDVNAGRSCSLGRRAALVRGAQAVR
jgi:hypothetical protein